VADDARKLAERILGECQYHLAHAPVQARGHLPHPQDVHELARCYLRLLEERDELETRWRESDNLVASLRKRQSICCNEWLAARQHHGDCPLMANDRVERSHQWHERAISAEEERDELARWKAAAEAALAEHESCAHPAHAQSIRKAIAARFDK